MRLPPGTEIPSGVDGGSIALELHQVNGASWPKDAFFGRIAWNEPVLLIEYM